MCLLPLNCHLPTTLPLRPQAIARAHDSLRPGRLGVAVGELLQANINRSPTAYLENPEAVSRTCGPC